MHTKYFYSTLAIQLIDLYQQLVGKYLIIAIAYN